MSTALIARPLWELEETLQALLDTIDVTPDEQREEIQTEIDRYIGAELVKVDHVAQAIAMCEYAAKDAAMEISRLQERKRAAEAAQARLEKYVVRVIEARGVKKLLGKTNTLSLRPSEGVVIADEAAVPMAHKTAVIEMPLLAWHGLINQIPEEQQDAVLGKLTKRDIKISRDSVKRAIKAGETVPGADLEFRNNLQRK